MPQGSLLLRGHATGSDWVDRNIKFDVHAGAVGRAAHAQQSHTSSLRAPCMQQHTPAPQTQLQ